MDNAPFSCRKKTNLLFNRETVLLQTATHAGRSKKICKEILGQVKNVKSTPDDARKYVKKF
jgi:hypothetical protein